MENKLDLGGNALEKDKTKLSQLRIEEIFHNPAVLGEHTGFAKLREINAYLMGDLFETQTLYPEPHLSAETAAQNLSPKDRDFDPEKTSEALTALLQ